MTDLNEPDGNRIDRGERMFCMDHFRIAAGDRIWRPVDFKPTEGLTMQEATKSGKLTKIIREFESAELTERQTYMLRASHAQFHVNPDALWAYTPNVRIGEKIVSRVGLVVFLKEPITPDWTWLIVTSITKKGNALYAQPFNGEKDELLEQYIQPSAPKK
jgi:hypothetical protein